MEALDKLLLACTRQDLLVEHQDEIRDIACNGQVQWDIVYQTALDHGVAPLIYTNLRQCGGRELGIPKGIMEQFQLTFFQNMSIKEHERENLIEALCLFEAMGTDVMLIKGVALDAPVYRDPYVTMSQDMDIVLRVRKEELTEKELRNIGESLHRKGIEYDFFEHHDVTMNNALPVDFNRIWDDAQSINLSDKNVYVMSPEDLLIAACINSCRKRFFRLKSMCDIAEISKKYPDLNWQVVIDNSIAWECNYIVYTALLVTRRLLGCDIQEEIIGDLKVSQKRARLIHYLIDTIQKQRTLASLFPFSGKMIFSREIEPSLLLPYASYRNYQIGRKLQEVFRAWRGNERYLL
jgi:hypothetical protein